MPKYAAVSAVNKASVTHSESQPYVKADTNNVMHNTAAEVPNIPQMATGCMRLRCSQAETPKRTKPKIVPRITRVGGSSAKNSGKFITKKNAPITVSNPPSVANERRIIRSRSHHGTCGLRTAR